mmetsp:Transcript_52718/g.94868  ORF Transcript_52718/g.94868 Transcript_52718/m.94868 type:complete len:213 (-) Transcript_52718:176-814(-)
MLPSWPVFFTATPSASAACRPRRGAAPVAAAFCLGGLASTLGPGPPGELWRERFCQRTPAATRDAWALGGVALFPPGAVPFFVAFCSEALDGACWPVAVLSTSAAARLRAEAAIALHNSWRGGVQEVVATKRPAATDPCPAAAAAALPAACARPPRAAPQATAAPLPALAATDTWLWYGKLLPASFQPGNPAPWPEANIATDECRDLAALEE